MADYYVNRQESDYYVNFWQIEIRILQWIPTSLYYRLYSTISFQCTLSYVLQGKNYPDNSNILIWQSINKATNSRRDMVEILTKFYSQRFLLGINNYTLFGRKYNNRIR